MESPEINYIERPPNSICTVQELINLIRYEAHRIAAIGGICLIRKGAVAPRVRRIISEVSGQSYVNQDETEAEHADKSAARIFFKASNGLTINAFLHKHGSVGIVPESTTMPTVIAPESVSTDLFIKTMKKQLQELDKDKYGLSSKADWEILKNYIRDESNPEIIEELWTKLGLSLRQNIQFNEIGIEIARTIQLELDGMGALIEVPWSEFDGGVIHSTSIHARDCRTHDTRTDGALHTLSLSN